MKGDPISWKVCLLPMGCGLIAVICDLCNLFKPNLYQGRQNRDGDTCNAVLPAFRKVPKANTAFMEMAYQCDVAGNRWEE